MLTSTRPLKLLHIDLFGSIAYISIGDNKYGLVIVDDFSHFTWVFFLQDKSEAQGVVKKFIRRSQNEYELKIKNVRSDNVSEFWNTNIEEFLNGTDPTQRVDYTKLENNIDKMQN